MKKEGKKRKKIAALLRETQWFIILHLKGDIYGNYIRSSMWYFQIS